MTSSTGQGLGLRWQNSSMSYAQSAGTAIRLAWVWPARPAGGRARQARRGSGPAPRPGSTRARASSTRVSVGHRTVRAGLRPVHSSSWPRVSGSPSRASAAMRVADRAEDQRAAHAPAVGQEADHGREEGAHGAAGVVREALSRAAHRRRVQLAEERAEAAEDRRHAEAEREAEHQEQGVRRRSGCWCTRGCSTADSSANSRMFRLRPSRSVR